MCGGTAWDDQETAQLLAVAEAAERYAGSDLLGEESIWATARELAGQCLDPERYPQCSAQEYANRACPVTRFDPSAPIRWVRGLDLVSQQQIWVPAVMACYSLADVVPAEEFTYRLSTGYAVHTDPVEAAVRGLCEVVERDIISILWLQQLPLPALSPQDHTAELDELIEWCRRRFIRVHLFDATSDIGVPAAYCVLAADHDRRACRVVGAGTGRNLSRAAQKALHEAITGIDLSRDGEIPSSLADFHDISDGGRFMAVPERSGAFNFLLTGAAPANPQRRSPDLPGSPDEALSALVRSLADAGMRPVVVDRTPVELAAVGLTAVNAIVPELQPMSLHPLAQFKAHPRLYQAPARMGYRVLAEGQLNPWPQPFA
ncbi:MAG: hypothetical protein HOY76_23405 [Streptomyces sp.]|nr:hypothetical protein [Streptomyces sp.]